MKVVSMASAFDVDLHKLALLQKDRTRFFDNWISDSRVSTKIQGVAKHCANTGRLIELEEWKQLGLNPCEREFLIGFAAPDVLLFEILTTIKDCESTHYSRPQPTSDLRACHVLLPFTTHRLFEIWQQSLEIEISQRYRDRMWIALMVVALSAGYWIRVAIETWLT